MHYVIWREREREREKESQRERQREIEREGGDVNTSKILTVGTWNIQSTASEPPSI